MASILSRDALFQIERALAEENAADSIALLSCKQIFLAVVAGVSGTHWCTNFIRIAELAGQHGKYVMCCCALLAELIVAEADASDNEKAAAANDSTVVDPSAGACSQAAHGHCAAVGQPLVGNKRACTMVTRNGTSSAGRGYGEHGTSDGLASIGHLASLMRSRGKGAYGREVKEHLARLVAGRQQALLQRGDIAAANGHPYHGKCPEGHLSVRSAWGAAGKLTKLTMTKKTTQTIELGQRDRFRKYVPLENHIKNGPAFVPLGHAIGFKYFVQPSVLENGVSPETPVRQELHVDGAPSVIVPLRNSGCWLDCLMQPDDKSPGYYYRVAIFVPAGHCVVFDTFHGGSTGTADTADRRVHAYLGPAPLGAVGHLLLETMLTTGNPDVTKYLDKVPTREELQKQVPHAIELVCKVDSSNGREYDPFPGHHSTVSL